MTHHWSCSAPHDAVLSFVTSVKRYFLPPPEHIRTASPQFQVAQMGHRPGPSQFYMFERVNRPSDGTILPDPTLSSDAVHIRQKFVSHGSGLGKAYGPVPDEVITWKGAIRPGQRLVDGMRIDWDKPPADFRIRVLAGSKGAHWADATDWTSIPRDVANGTPIAGFSQNVIFHQPMWVKELQVQMRDPAPYGYFGINQLALITHPCPSKYMTSAFR
ncbi:hypothetical protein FOZ62_032422 [Perkinsus olseni]|uniref:Uncharacterized protein n=1 Tax=Perkinsus olseni TaxID=32597 RepID=A0A7J6SK43_PEROL|nr:hypothetical protein FOZ62_032422 [Perkinsus olseni]